MGWFEFARTSERYPTRYSDQRTASPIDLVIVGLIISLVIVGIPFYAILPAYSKSKRRPLLARITVGLVIGGIILGGNYGHNWEIGKLHMSSPYKPSSHEEVVGEIELHIALRGINITLIDTPSNHSKSHEDSELAHETIDYNEHFSWEWAQGRFGFGYYAGQISKDFREATLRGVPLPILQIAEYFTFDGEGIRFGRYYRLSGWYAHQLMWAAFGTWLISNILFCMIVNTASYFLVLTGLLQLSAIGVWTFSRNPIEIQIPFQSADGREDVLLKTHFGLDYYLVFGNGCLCVLLGLLLIVLDGFIPDEMCQFFGIDPLTIYDEFRPSKEEEIETAEKDVPARSDVSMMEMGDLPSQHPAGVQAKSVSFYGSVGGGEDSDTEGSGSVVLKRRENLASKLFQGSFRIKPKVYPRRTTKPTSGGEIYESSRQQQPLLGKPSGQSDSDDEARRESWPPPPAETILRKPPPPPPKRYNK